jgi:hypothetical protein
VRTASIIIALMMEAVRTYETSVYFNETTRRYTPEGCHLRLHDCFVKEFSSTKQNHILFYAFYCHLNLQQCHHHQDIHYFHKKMNLPRLTL